MVGDPPVLPGELGGQPGPAGGERAADGRTHRGADHLAVGIDEVAALRRIDARAHVAQGDLLGRVGEGDEPHPLVGDVVGIDRVALFTERLEQRELEGDVVVEGLGGLDVAVDLPEHLPQPGGFEALHRRAERRADDLAQPARVHPVEELLPAGKPVIGIVAELRVLQVLLKALVDHVGPVGVPLDLGGLGERLEHPRVEDLQVDEAILPDRVERQRDELVRLGDVVAHVRHAADRAEHLGVGRLRLGQGLGPRALAALEHLARLLEELALQKVVPLDEVGAVLHRHRAAEHFVIPFPRLFHAVTLLSVKL